MKKLKILVVDDNKINMELMSKFITNQGYEAICFLNPVSAFNSIASEKPDAILLDVMMPGMDGMDLCRKIRNNKDFENIKIVMCTTKNYESDRKMAKEAGADAYIAKPFTKKSVKIIERVVNHETEVKFWGVRGTLPVSSRRSTKYGGNTSCVAVTFPDESIWIFDAGTGIKFLSDELMQQGLIRKNIKIFISHPHWDHINALPFFSPLYIPGNKIEIYGPKCQGKSIRELVFSQMDNVHFPITSQEMGADISFTDLQEETKNFGNIKLSTILLTHPGNCLGYRIDHGNFSVCYMTDNEFYLPDNPSFSQERYDNLVSFSNSADLLITDTTYTDETYPQKVNWGHSCVSQVVNFACETKCKTLAIFHHDPEQDDSHIDKKLNQAKKSIKSSNSNLNCIAPVEEQAILLSQSDKEKKIA